MDSPVYDAPMSPSPPGARFRLSLFLLAGLAFFVLPALLSLAADWHWFAEVGYLPVLTLSITAQALVGGTQLPDLELRDDLYDDFCLTPFHPVEVEARLRHLLYRGGAELRPEMVEHSGLMLNLETYQASIEGRPLDLTYMEYELLKFLAQNPGKVFTREMLLSRVWGYEYYGGARTVDVHIRRLRAKLGEEHASLIQTVRSVGFRIATRTG